MLNKVTLIHTKDQFKLMIDEKELKSISSYTVSANSERQDCVELKLEMTVYLGDIEVNEREMFIGVGDKATKEIIKKALQEFVAKYDTSPKDKE